MIPAKLSINHGPYQRITIKLNESNQQRINYLDAGSHHNTIRLDANVAKFKVSINDLMKTVKLQIGENSYRIKKLDRTGMHKIANVLSPDWSPDKDTTTRKSSRKKTHKQSTQLPRNADEDGDEVLIPATLSIHRRPDKRIHIKVNESNKQQIQYLDADNNPKTIRFSSFYMNSDSNDATKTVRIQTGNKKYCFKMLNKKGVKQMVELLDKP